MPLVKINENTPQERVIGYLDDQNRIFKKLAFKSRHLFRKLDAFGVDAIYFTDVLLPDKYKIQVWEKEEDVVYEVDSSKLKEFGTFYHFKNDKGQDHRAQIFLPRRYWDKISGKDQRVRDDYLKYFA